MTKSVYRTLYFLRLSLVFPLLIAVGSANSANIFLDSGDTFTLRGPSTVFGSTGTETIVINTGATGVVVDQNVERVELQGALSAYQFQQGGNRLLIYSGAVLLVTVPLQGDSDGTQIGFTGGSGSAKLSSSGVMTLCGTTVPASGNPVTIATCTGTPTLSLSVSDVTVSESAGTATVPVSLSTTSASMITASYGTSNGTATAGSDYTAKSGTLTFAPGTTSQNIVVAILEDTVAESSETINVNLLSATGGATIGRGTGVITITDNDTTGGGMVWDVGMWDQGLWN